MSILTALSSITSRKKALKQEISHSWEDREVIQVSDVNLFCWKRPENPEISSYMEYLVQKDVDSIRHPVNVENMETQIEKISREWEADPGSRGQAFWSDVTRLTRDFLHFSKHKEGTLHLKLVSDNGCSKFHTDGYAMRLFTTYYGEGTEWLPESAVNRSGLGKTNEKIVKDASQIQRMRPFEVGILKGELYNRSETSIGIVHRSPPVGDSGGKRIILRIDI